MLGTLSTYASAIVPPEVVRPAVEVGPARPRSPRDRVVVQQPILRRASPRIQGEKPLRVSSSVASSRLRGPCNDQLPAPETWMMRASHVPARSQPKVSPPVSSDFRDLGEDPAGRFALRGCAYRLGR
jgi:hypothetical protein